MRPQTTKPVEFWVPTPPSVNNAYANSYGGKFGRTKSQDYLRWETVAGQEIMRQKVKKIAGPVTLELYHGGLPANSDISNRIKTVEDLLVALDVIDGDTIKTVIRVSSTAVPKLVGTMVVIKPFQPRLDGPEVWRAIYGPNKSAYYHMKMP